MTNWGFNVGRRLAPLPADPVLAGSWRS